MLIIRGMVSSKGAGGYPQNVWAVTDGGEPLEPQLENADRGTYHGYPMPEADPFRKSVLNEWKRRRDIG